jgi:hypothetical protein
MMFVSQKYLNDVVLCSFVARSGAKDTSIPDSCAKEAADETKPEGGLD